MRKTATTKRALMSVQFGLAGVRSGGAASDASKLCDAMRANRQSNAHGPQRFSTIKYEFRPAYLAAIDTRIAAKHTSFRLHIQQTFTIIEIIIFCERSRDAPDGPTRTAQRNVRIAMRQLATHTTTASTSVFIFTIPTVSQTFVPGAMEAPAHRLRRRRRRIGVERDDRLRYEARRVPFVRKQQSHMYQNRCRLGGRGMA